IAGEPWPLRRRGFSPLYGCYYHRDLQQRTVHWTSRPSFRPNAAPAYRHGFDPVSLGIGTWLSPVYFRRPQPRPVSCYALLGGWLLLSLPSPSFRPASSYSGLDHSVSSVIPVITGPFRPCPSRFMRIRATDNWFPCDSRPYSL